MTALAEHYERLIQHALALPEAWEDHPWGERVVKVRKKVFVFSGFDPETGRMGVSLKLPVSGAEALQRAEAAPTGYGLGKSGWVSLRYGAGDAVPVSLLLEWIEESYRAVAPKTLARQLD